MKNKVIRPVIPEDLIHILPESGVFEILDCNVYIMYPEHATTGDLEKITGLIHSMVHVEDIQVHSQPIDGDRYRIEIEETKPSTSRTLPNSKREK